MNCKCRVCQGAQNVLSGNFVIVIHDLPAHIYKYCTTSLSVEPYMAAAYIPMINIFYEEI